MNRITLLITLLFALGFTPVQAQEESPPAPEVQLFCESSNLYECCRALRDCEGLSELQEYAALLRGYCEERLADCRAHRQNCLYDSDEAIHLRSQTDQFLADCEAALCAPPHKACTDGERPIRIARAQACLPSDAAGEPYLCVPKAQSRLHAARLALFDALGRAGIRTHGNQSEETLLQVLGELLPLYADFRRELQIWGTRTLSEERRARWMREHLRGFNVRSVRYGEAEAWLSYLREDAEEAAAQYDTCWRRACRYAAADISAGLRNTPEALLATESAWVAGEPLGQGATAEQVFFYRLRDAHAFCMLACPLGGSARRERVFPLQSLPERALAELALFGEQQVIAPQLERMLPTCKGYALSPSWPSPYEVSEGRVLEELRVRASISPASLSPVGSSLSGDLNQRVEAEAAAMQQALDAAEKFVPQLHETPDAAALRLLVQLAAQWNAYTNTLRIRGYMDDHRRFWWYGGCMGYRPIIIWGDAYYLAGIKLSRLENDKLIHVDQCNAHTLITALIGEMREQLNASLEEHRHPKPGRVYVVEPEPPMAPPGIEPQPEFESTLPEVEENGCVEMPLPDSLAPTADERQHQ